MAIQEKMGLSDGEAELNNLPVPQDSSETEFNIGGDEGQQVPPLPDTNNREQDV